VRISESKTAVPELHAGFTTRPRLLAQLDRVTADQLVVVVAPPGYGKTLLLADWVRRGGPRTAWVSVDEDDDATRLVSSLLTALRKLPALRGHAELHRIEREAGEHPGRSSTRSRTFWTACGHRSG
jgi:LuxR family transcriptional regulator, maltose regulon positive regulatory protein